ncbi:metallophosphoesterase family protein [Oribacterium sp. FC2011]|uniref:metallophosphoesterase family protein n=1 Tax=Oribacterium sp. FC2011 TaxID=1408311 RepID=UPI0009DDB04E
MTVEQEIELEGYCFYMVHNIKHIREDLSGIDFVVYGHSHKYENRQKDGITYLNPGSCGPRRFTQPVINILKLY